jgi:hypothetical protein
MHQKTIAHDLDIHQVVSLVTAVGSQFILPCRLSGMSLGYDFMSIAKFWVVNEKHTSLYSVCAGVFESLEMIFFNSKAQYIKQARRLIKNIPVPLRTLVRKRVRQKRAASGRQSRITILVDTLHHTRRSRSSKATRGATLA